LQVASSNFYIDSAISLNLCRSETDARKRQEETEREQGSSSCSDHRCFQFGARV
jgi:hypothetical protein